MVQPSIPIATMSKCLRQYGPKNMSYLFSIEELTQACEGRAENIHASHINSISIDSRTVLEGGLYVAIKGDRFDGHDFVHKAIVQGAAVALISEKRARELAGLPLIIVADPLVGMAQIARVARARSRAKIVAITGSAGKTTTKNMVENILAKAGETHASIKSYNNHWGVPLMLANMPQSAEFGVFEIGMNHADEITPLVDMVRPHIALVSNVGPAHIGNFDGLEGIARAKAEIFSGLEPGGLAIINNDHGQVEILKKAARLAGAEIVTYGFSKSADVGIFDYFPHENGGTAQARFGTVGVNFEINVPGQHMIENATGALCVAHHMGVGFDVAVAALSSFSASAGRGAEHILGPKDNPIVLIDESYNANPASMTAALQVFAVRDKGMGRKILILGDMLELGEGAAGFHRDLQEVVVATDVDKLFLIGKEMDALKSALPDRINVVAHGENLAAINDTILNSLDYGDKIMVKGSLGVGLARIVAQIVDRFGQQVKAKTNSE